MLYMKWKAAIFDWDGTLADSMWVWDNLLIDFLSEYGFEASDKILSDIAYMTITQSSGYIKSLYNLPMSAEDICQKWKDMVYHRYAEEVKLKAGAKEYLAYLKENGIKIALATACAAELCEVCMESNDVKKYMDEVIYADDVGKGKSDPQIYIETLKRLGVKAEETMLFEDILTAVKTGKGIGLSVTVVEDAGAESERELLKQHADVYIRNYFELMK